MAKNNSKQEADLFENTAFGTFETEGENKPQDNEILKAEDIFGSEEQPNAFMSNDTRIFDSEAP